MIKRRQRLLGVLNMVLDGVLILLSYVCALWLRFDVLRGVRSVQLSHPRVVVMLLCEMLLLLMAYAALGLYSGDRLRRRREEGLLILLVNGLGTLALMAAFYVVRIADFSRLMLAMFWLISSVSLTLKRALLTSLLAYYRRRGYNLKHVVIVGSGHLANQYAQDIRENPHKGFSIAGYIGQEGQDAIGPHLGDYAQVGEVLERINPDEVIVAMEPKDIDLMPSILSAADKEGVRLSLIPYFNDYIPKAPTITALGHTKLIDLRVTPLDEPVWAMTKRTMDIVGAAVLIVLFSPIMLAVAVGVKLTSPGPILFRQERVGKNKKPFKMLKFRSMRITGTEDTGWSTNDDPRKTRFGSLIRKFSLDELPQFFNVLRGDMSLVGPRPEVPYHVRRFKEEVPLYLLRQQVRPGITGWAQVNGLRGDTSIEARVEYDLWYIENWSVWLDIKILLRTALGGMVNKEVVGGEKNELRR